MFDYKKTVKEYEDLKNQNPNIYKNINELYNDTEIDCIYVAANPEGTHARATHVA